MNHSVPEVAVSRTADGWVIEHPKLKVRLSEATLGLRIEQPDGETWESLPGPDDAIVAVAAGAERRAPLTSAAKRRFRVYRTGYCVGVRADLSDFAPPSPGGAAAKAGDATIPSNLALIAAVEATTGELVCQIIAEERGVFILSVRWPPAFELPKAAANYTVWPLMQGMLLPSDWAEDASFTTGFPGSDRTFTRALYMPWWGQVKDGHGYIAILETPYDAGGALSHPPGGPTVAQPVWHSSLGHFSYRRVIRYAFFEKANHVTLAKRYRKYAQSIGWWRSLAEKAAGNPRIGTLLGGAIYSAGILTHIQPDSLYYRKDAPAANHQCVTFEQRAKEIAEIARKSGLRGEFHLDGWGVRGYDNLHPDVLPACPEAGGWQGMRVVADACAQSGWVFAIHDNYRDFYFDAPSYSPDLAVNGPNGELYEHAIWLGGKQALLCAALAPGYLRRNLDAIRENGVNLAGIYLDVFAIADLDECFHPDHRMTREECAAYRIACFDECRSRGLVVSSEEPVDFPAAHIDLVHHAPYAQRPDPGRPAKEKQQIGIACPLFSLVYHDAVVVPWSFGKGAWGIPPADDGFLHALLNGGIGYIGLDENAIKQCRIAAELHRRVGFLEMTNHEYLDGDGLPAAASAKAWRRQRSTFADGTTVEVNFDTGEHKIKPGR